MGKKKQWRIATWDCETDPFGWNKNSFEDNEVHPFISGLYILDDGTYHEFFNDDLSEYGCYSGIRKFVEFIQDEDLLIYAHNGGKFDFMFLLPWLDPNITLVNGRIAKATIGNCEFRDSFMILPVPLSSMEKDIGFDYEKMHYKKRAKHIEEIRTYLRNDCVYLGNWVHDFIDRYGVQFTLAGTSMKEIKKSGIPLVRSFPDYDAQFRKYYFGGRTQCFKKGYHKGPLVYYDINSAYPYAMLHKHPIGTTRTQFIKKNGQAKLPEGRDCVFFADIRAISKGCLPLRNPDTKKLEYPDDDEIREYKTTCWEIWAGLDTGTLEIIEVLDGWRFIDVGDFSSFIIPYYEQKNASVKGSPEYLFSKLIMNAGYGKWGLNVGEFKNYVLTPFGKHPMSDEPVPDYPPTTEEEAEIYYEWKSRFDAWSLYADHNEYSVWEQPDPGTMYNNVATAASITGFVRAYLWRHICQCKNVLYCDTDSVVCSEFAGNIGDELGQWSLECYVRQAWIAQRKMYCLEVESNPWKTKVETKRRKKRNVTTLSIEYKPDYKTASKGVRLSPEEIIRGVNDGGKVTYEKPSPAFSVKYAQRFLRKTIDFDA